MNLEDAVAEIAADHVSGASELVARALAILRGARLQGREEVVRAAVALCRAQPSMASIWNLAAAAVDDLDSQGVLDRFAHRLHKAPQALARYAVDTLTIDRNGSSDGLRVATCSRSRSVMTCLAALAGRGRFTVLCAEGRPMFEGRTLAVELQAAGIDVELFTDGAFASALREAHVLLVGADAVTSSWFVNKCGTYAAVLSIHALSIPAFVLASRDKFLSDTLGARLPLGEGPPGEVWPEAPAGVKVRNPYFERIPAALVTTFISDGGPVTPDRLRSVCPPNSLTALVKLMS